MTISTRLLACGGCTRRYPGCHGKCPEYAKFKADRELHRQDERKNQDAVLVRRAYSARMAAIRMNYQRKI